MKIFAVAALGFAAILGPTASFASSSDLSSARARGAYDVKKAQCKQKAKAMKFGVHFIKRNRWIKNCIAT